MSVEIEAKFRVDDDQIFPLLLQTHRLGRFQLWARPAPEYQHTTYFDSPDERLRAIGYSLRIREVAGRRTATLKRTRSKSAEIKTRDEWECAVGPDDDPQRWPDGAVRGRVLAALAGRAVAPLFAIDTRRQIIHALLDGQPVADLCLDDAIVRAGARAASFRELEVELRAARQRRAFGALLTELRLSFPLFPEQRSKKSRGLALRASAAPGAPVCAVGA